MEDEYLDIELYNIDQTFGERKSLHPSFLFRPIYCKNEFD